VESSGRNNKNYVAKYIFTVYSYQHNKSQRAYHYYKINFLKKMKKASSVRVCRRKKL